MTAILVVLTLVFFVSLDAFRLYLERRREARSRELAPVRPFAPVALPRGLFLDRSHTWARMTDSGALRVGIDELVTQAVGSADSIKLPLAGQPVRRGEPLATLMRKGRRLSIPSPVDGTVVSSNTNLLRSPQLLADDAYGAGWLVSIWPVEVREALRAFSVGEAARRLLEREIQRLGDFLTLHSTPATAPALADGAHPIVGATSHLDERGWREFQREFCSCE
jgi:glycine cleavage system H protein